MIKGQIAKASITWREDLIEDEGNFYIKLSPDIRYSVTNAKKLADAVAKEGLEEMKKGIKGVK